MKILIKFIVLKMLDPDAAVAVALVLVLDSTDEPRVNVKSGRKIGT